MALTLICHAQDLCHTWPLEPGRAGLSNKNRILASRLKLKRETGQDGLKGKADLEMVTMSEQVHGACWLSCSWYSSQHTSYLQLFIILKLFHRQIGLRISLLCTEPFTSTMILPMASAAWNAPYSTQCKFTSSSWETVLSHQPQAPLPLVRQLHRLHLNIHHFCLFRCYLLVSFTSFMVA